MALDTYTNLKTAIQAWMSRADLSANIDDMIDLFEAWVNRNVRAPQMEQEATATATEYLDLPNDFLELRDIQWQGSPRVQLEYFTPAVADVMYPGSGSGIPRFYTIVNDQLRLIPAPSGTTNVRIAYWKKVPALSGSTATNWLLDLYPDAYLYGAMVHGNVRIQDEELAAIIEARWRRVMNEMKAAGQRRNYGSLLQIRVV